MYVYVYVYVYVHVQYVVVEVVVEQDRLKKTADRVRAAAEL